MMEVWQAMFKIHPIASNSFRYRRSKNLALMKAWTLSVSL